MTNISKNSYLALILILISAFLLRLPLIDGSFWMDEAAQALEIVRPLSEQLNIKEDFQPPLLHLILHFAAYFSTNEIYLRVIGALLPAMIAIVFNYKLFLKLAGQKISLITTALLATSSFHIFYSQELRPYALPLMFASISWFYLSEYQKNSDKNYLIKVAVANSLGLFSSYLYPFLIIGQIFYVFVAQKKTINITFYFLSLIFNAVTFIPWLPKFLEQLAQGGVVRETLPRWEEVVSIPQLKSIPLVFLKFTFGVVDIEANFYYLLAISSIFIFVSLAFYLEYFDKKNKTQKRSNKQNVILVAAWIFVPLITAFLVSFFVPVVQPKRVLFSIPAFFFLLSLCYQIISEKSQKLAMTFLLILFAINISGTYQYYTNPKLQRENWLDLRNQIRSEFNSKDTAIIYSFDNTFAPLVWYDISEFKNISTKYLYIKNVPDLANTLKPALEYKNVLVFDYLRDLTDPDREIDIYLKNNGYEEVRAITYPNIGPVRVFVKSNELISSRAR